MQARSLMGSCRQQYTCLTRPSRDRLRAVAAARARDSERENHWEWYGLSFPRGYQRRLIAMLYGYLDASGTHEGSSVLSVAGYVWSFENWKRANRKWQRFLDDNGLEFFHMTDFEAYEGPYKNWTPKRHRAVIKRLIQIIADTASVGVAVGIASRDHAALSAIPDGLEGSAYQRAATVCMTIVARWIHEQRSAESVKYILEFGDETQDLLRRHVMASIQSPSFQRTLRIESLNFERKRTTPALQAADILAYEYAKEAPRRLGLATRPPRKSLIALEERLRHRSAFLDWEKLHTHLIQLQDPDLTLKALSQMIGVELGIP